MVPIFDISIQDSQGTSILPIEPGAFDLDRYANYEASLLDKNTTFVEAGNGLLVYRRVRANGIFYDKCQDFKESLALQLGALKESMKYKADIANFLEPWYGIGYIASCFGCDYVWKSGQAPSVLPVFHTVQQLFETDCTPIEQTPIGKHILEMEEYFLDKTKGKLPISFCDVQSPLNMLSYLLPINDLFMEVYDDPDTVAKAANLTADLLIAFLKKQRELIGGCLASPGHGFASSRKFHGIGLSNDNAIMLRPEDYHELFQPSDEKIGDVFGGTAFHSCGNWESKIPMVKDIHNLIMIDGAFSIQTDPSPNDPSVFGRKFAGSGIIVNARAVGNGEECYKTLCNLWAPNQKLIAVTYCKDPKDQEILYDKLHAL